MFEKKLTTKEKINELLYLVSSLKGQEVKYNITTIIDDMTITIVDPSSMNKRAKKEEKKED